MSALDAGIFYLFEYFYFCLNKMAIRLGHTALCKCVLSKLID